MPSSRSILVDDAVAASERLQKSISQVIAALPRSISKAADLQRCLGLDSALAWNLYRAATARSALSVGRCVPGERAMERFLTQAQATGVPSALVKEARSAFTAFEEMITHHAGDRAAYESMLADLQGTGNDQFDLRQKRAAFRANRHIWGWETKVIASCSVVHASATPGFMDHVLLAGEVGLRHLRDGRLLRNLNQITVSHSDLPDAAPITARPVDPDDPRADIGLFSEFCSKPVPSFESRRSEDGSEVSTLASTSLGNTGAVTYFQGANFGAMPMEPPGKELFYFTRSTGKPAELLVQDVLLHEAVWSGGPPDIQVFTRKPRDDEPEDEVDPLPIQERVQVLEGGTAAMGLREAPEYQDVIRFALGKLGWSESRFHVYRLRIEYPVLHAFVRMQFGTGGD